MDTLSSQPRTIILLDEQESGTVKAVQKDRDTFCLSVQDAIEGCKFVASTYSTVQQIADLHDELAEWIEERKSAIHSAAMSFRSDGILFVVMQKEIGRDDALASDLTELDIAIASNDAYEDLTFDVLSIPRSSQEAAAAFLSSGRVKRYAGEKRSRDAGEGES